jgi:hypothetical protein
MLNQPAFASTEERAAAAIAAAGWHYNIPIHSVPTCPPCCFIHSNMTSASGTEVPGMLAKQLLPCRFVIAAVSAAAVSAAAVSAAAAAVSAAAVSATAASAAASAAAAATCYIDELADQ